MESMDVCTKCGSKIDFNFNFCASCGNQIIIQKGLICQHSYKEAEGYLYTEPQTDSGKGRMMFKLCFKEFPRERYLQKNEEKRSLGWVKGAVAAFLILLIFLILIPTPSNNYSQGTVSKSQVCKEVDQAYGDFINYLAQWRGVSNNLPYMELEQVALEVNQKLLSISYEIQENDITWDSAAIVSGLIGNLAADIKEISDSTYRGYFLPGRDLQKLLNDIDLNAYGILGSACDNN